MQRRLLNDAWGIPHWWRRHSIVSSLYLVQEFKSCIHCWNVFGLCPGLQVETEPHAWAAVPPAWWENARPALLCARRCAEEGRGRGPVRAFTGLCCRATAAGGCDTCDARSDENADGGGSYCSGELMSSRGPLFILDGSMDPHCACGFCSRWFFSMDFSPSVKHMQAPWVPCPSVWTCSLLKYICTAAPAGPLWAESGLNFTKEGFLEAFLGLLSEACSGVVAVQHWMRSMRC